MTIAATTGLIVSNFGSALQPVVAKVSKLTTYDQTIVRILVFAIGCILWSNHHYDLSWLRSSFYPSNLLMNGVNVLSIYSGIQGFRYLPVGIGLTTFYTWPLFLAIFAEMERRSKKNKLTKNNRRRLWIGLIISFFGLFILFSREWYQWIYQDSQNWTMGFIWIIISAITHSLTIFYYHEQGEHASERFGLLTVPTAILLLLFMIWNSDYRLGSYPDFYWQVGLLGLFQATVGFASYLMHFWSISELPKEWISSLGFLTLFIGYFIGWFLFGETMNWRILLGTFCVFVGVGLVSRALNMNLNFIKNDFVKNKINRTIKIND